LQLLHGPYQPPSVRVGQTVTCVLRGKAKVCRWSDGLIPWPIIRVGHGGRGAYAVTPELARAVRSESSAAVAHWWGASSVTVSLWRRALGVEQFNEGTRRLWSLWKEPKLPDTCVTFSKAALRQHRLAGGMTQRQVARAVGWNSVHTYGQMESGGRWRATRETLARLAKVLGCRAEDLIVENK
jgi:DNA-binding XRE family transcriptional regulator